MFMFGHDGDDYDEELMAHDSLVLLANVALVLAVFLILMITQGKDSNFIF